MRRGWRQIFAGAVAVALALIPALGFAGTSNHGSVLSKRTSPRGDAATLFIEAIHLENGEGVERNPFRALALYCEAGSLGEPRAYFSLGWMYLNGRGVPRNDALAAAWLHKAAHAGVAEAANLLQMLGGPAGASSVPSCAALARAHRFDGPGFATNGAAFEAPVAPTEIRALVDRIAPWYGLDTGFVTAVIAAESGFKTNAVSPKRAMGLMQLMPQTAERFGVLHPFDAAENIRGGVSYLSWLLGRYGGNVDLALAAYNAGEGAVEAYGGVPPFRETREYVARVESIYGGATGSRSDLLATPHR